MNLQKTTSKAQNELAKEPGDDKRGKGVTIHKEYVLLFCVILLGFSVVHLLFDDVVTCNVVIDDSMNRRIDISDLICYRWHGSCNDRSNVRFGDDYTIYNNRVNIHNKSLYDDNGKKRTLLINNVKTVCHEHLCYFPFKIYPHDSVIQFSPSVIFYGNAYSNFLNSSHYCIDNVV